MNKNKSFLKFIAMSSLIVFPSLSNAQRFVYDTLQDPYGNPEEQVEAQKNIYQNKSLNKKGWLPRSCLNHLEGCDVRGSVTAAVFDDFKEKYDLPQHSSLIAETWICGEKNEEDLQGKPRTTPCSENDTVAIAKICISDQVDKFCKRDWIGSAYYYRVAPKFAKLNLNFAKHQKSTCSYQGMVDDFVHLEQKNDRKSVLFNIQKPANWISGC